MVSSFRRKLVIVGDNACGKTCLLNAWAHGKFPEYWVPSIFEAYVAEVDVGAKHVELALWDTAGGDENYERLRPLSYPNAHVILICLAIDSPNALAHVQEKWASEVSFFCPDIPILLVGCKKDLRQDPVVLEDLARMNQQPISFEEGMRLAHKIGAKHYFECSAKIGEGVDMVFQTATREALQVKSILRNHGACLIL